MDYITLTPAETVVVGFIFKYIKKISKEDKYTEKLLKEQLIIMDKFLEKYKYNNWVTSQAKLLVSPPKEKN